MRVSAASTSSSWSSGTSLSAAAAARGKLPPKIAIAFTSSRSVGVRASRRAAIRELRLAGTSSSPISPSRTSPDSVAAHHTAVRQRADRLQRVERDPLGLRGDARARRVGQAVDQAVEQLTDRGLVERVEVDRRHAAAAGEPLRALLHQLRPRQDHDEDRVLGRPLHQVRDERQHPGVGPVDVLEGHDDRVLVREPLEEQPPTREELLAAQAGLRDPEQRAEARGEERALLRVGDPALQALRELARRLLGGLVVGDAEAVADHLAQRPVGDAVAIGQTAPVVPEDVVVQAVEVLLELPQQARLADARGAGDDHEAHGAAIHAAVEELLDESQLGVAAHERRLQPVAALGAGDAGDDADRPPELERLLLALQGVRAGVGIGDGRGGRLARDVVHQHCPGLGEALDPRGGVDAVSDHERLAGIVEGRHLAGDDARAGAQLRRAHVLPEGGDRVDDLQAGPHGALGVVLAGHGRAPYRHHGVADELLDGPPVAPDDGLGGLEVPAEQLARLLGVACLGDRRVADEVHEKDRDHPQLGAGAHLCSDRLRRRDGRSRAPGQRRAALSAELLAGGVLGAAAPAPGRQGRAALGAELRAGKTLRSARGTGHRTAPFRGNPNRAQPPPCRRRSGSLAPGSRRRTAGTRGSARRPPGRCAASP